MDKYELNIKVEKIKKHAEKKDYAAAVKIADTIDWSKVKNIRMLTLVSQVYEKVQNYTEAKSVLLFAYERVPMGRRMLYKLTELCVKEGKIEEAENFFEEFQKAAPNDINKLLLTYQIESAKDGDLDDLIRILEQYRKSEFVEKWAYELACLYHRAGRAEECVQLCNEIILWFGVGDYVDRALNLKVQYEPLTPSEHEKLVNKKKYEDRVRAVKREFEKREYRGIREDDGEVVERRRKKEQMQEAAMTSESEPELETVSVPEESLPDKVIPFSAVSASKAPDANITETDITETDITETDIIEETSAALEQMLFAKETFSEKEQGAEPLTEEMSDMQASLAQAVQETEKEPEHPEEAPDEDAFLGQTKEVVRETREALGKETKENFEETDKYLNELSASLAKTAFPEEENTVEETPEEKVTAEETPEEAAAEETPEEETAAEEEPEEEAAAEEEPEEAAAAEEEPEEEAAAEEEPEEKAVAAEEPEEEAAAEEEPEEETAVEEEPEETPAEEESEEEAAAEETETFGEFEITCVVVETEPGPDRIPFAVEKLKKTHEVLGGRATQVAKISGAKLSARGIHNTFKRLVGRDLIVDNAADLSHDAAAELVEEMKRPRESMVLILVDTSARIDELLLANPELDQLCVYLDEGAQMDVDEFVACANAYAKEEECVINEMANLAICAAAERFLNDGVELTEEAAKKLVDGAIERAEHRGIKGLFGSKYNKEGYLILKEQFFKNV